jgi:hypothetical protein
MTYTQHTPGPWKVEPDSELAHAHPYHRTRFVTTADFDQDAHMGEIICRMSDAPNQVHNAVLLAAAPDLLKAMESLFNNCQMIHSHWGDNSNAKEADAAIAAARAAIAKATGNG